MQARQAGAYVGFFAVNDDVVGSALQLLQHRRSKATYGTHGRVVTGHVAAAGLLGGQEDQQIGVHGVNAFFGVPVKAKSKRNERMQKAKKCIARKARFHCVVTELQDQRPR